MTEHLYRSRDDRMLAGVAGGLAEIWEMDPSIVRVVWALLTILTGGIFLVVYIVMAIVVPEEPVGYRPPGPWPGAAGGVSAPGATPSPSGPSSPYVPGWVPPGPASFAPGPAPVVSGPAPVVPDAASAAPGAAGPTSWIDAREARRAARAARRAARGGYGNGSAGIVFGGLLVVIGIAFFAREVFPAFDFDLFWPLILVGLGVILLVASFGRDPNAGQGGPS